MKLAEALKIANAINPEARPLEVLLACGFTPLHFKTFLHAHLQSSRPDRQIAISSGLFGNLCETLESAQKSAIRNIVIVVEWSDLDPRLGYRASFVGSTESAADVVAACQSTVRRIVAALEKFRDTAQIVVCAPTLPLSLTMEAPRYLSGSEELVLRKLAVNFEIAAVDAGATVLNGHRLAEESPSAGRYDARADLFSGFPYSLAHADVLAASLGQLLLPTRPKKGIITDLDGTVWSGVVGEVGCDGVSWDLESGTQIHGVYQMLLADLGRQGTLLAIASKNDPRSTKHALERSDFLISAESIFPQEIHWEPKSVSVGRILKAWNIAAEDVVFVDDSPIELAEVQAVHPGIKCLQFSAVDPQKTLAMLRSLKDLCGNPRPTAEDELRRKSLQQAAEFRAESVNAHSETFLKSLQATLVIDFDAGVGDHRAFELVNKTNQFNLNGVRYTESDWFAELAVPGARLITVTYEDRFGKLGKISSLLGRCVDGKFHVKAWVMSCRAFSRRIEFALIRALINDFASVIEFDFLPTPKNGPIREFLRSVGVVSDGNQLPLSRSQFDAVCPVLYHHTTETRSLAANG
jgi:FkbH-like protein